MLKRDTSSYGRDLDSKTSLVTLLEQLCEIDKIKWIRLQYLYPASITDELLNIIANEEKICPYFDIPLQHISDTVLKSMKRPGKEFTLKLLEKIRTLIPNAAIRTSMIAGYPNESDSEFNELTRFISDFKFNRLGVFQYSREEDTSAFDLGDPVSEEIKEERHDIIMEIQQGISLGHNEKMIGEIIPVIIDSYNGEIAVGRTAWDAPEVDGVVYVEPSPEIEVGNIMQVEITAAEPYDVFGTIIH